MVETTSEGVTCAPLSRGVRSTTRQRGAGVTGCAETLSVIPTTTTIWMTFMKRILSGRPSYYLVVLDLGDGSTINVGCHAYKWQAKIDIRRRPTDMQYRY